MTLLSSLSSPDRLSDQALLDEIRRLAGRERAATAELVAATMRTAARLESTP